MFRAMTTAFMVLCLLAMASLAFAKPGTLNLKVGDEVYACACGKTCPCDAISLSPGQCPCGKDLVKAKVLKVTKNRAQLDVNGEQRWFKTKGKYACACGESCPCKMISQKPGKCTCGKEMKPVK